MSIMIIAHERDRLLGEAEQHAEACRAALTKLYDRHLVHVTEAPATFVTRIIALGKRLEDLAGHEALADMEPETAAPPACPDCKSPRVVDINAGCFGCAECGGLYQKAKHA